MDWITIIKILLSIFIAGVISLQFQSLQKWLLWGVAEAEEYLGSGTGQLKLQYVYNLAVEKYPIFVKLIPFNMFAWLVDRALENMRKWIEENKNIADILIGSDKIE